MAGRDEAPLQRHQTPSCFISSVINAVMCGTRCDAAGSGFTAQLSRIRSALWQRARRNFKVLWQYFKKSSTEKNYKSWPWDSSAKFVHFSNWRNFLNISPDSFQRLYSFVQEQIVALSAAQRPERTVNRLQDTEAEGFIMKRMKIIPSYLLNAGY